MGMGMTDEDLVLHDDLEQLTNLVTSSIEQPMVVLGDLILDRYIHGYANNLNSRAPVPVLVETERHQNVGAAAHIGRGLMNLGMSISMFGCVGDDEIGDQILEAIEGAGITISGIAVVEGRRSTTKTRMIARRESVLSQSQMLLRWDVESNDPVPDAAIDAIHSTAMESVADARILVISDYGLGVVEEGRTRDLIEAARSAGTIIISDPKLTGLHRVKGSDWVLFGGRGLDLLRRRMGVDTAEGAATILMEEHDWNHLLLLGGLDGTTAFHRNGATERFPCMITEARQEIGLHDAAAAALAVGLANGGNATHAGMLANAACECILSADRSNRFTLTKDVLVDRLESMIFQLKISRR